MPSSELVRRSTQHATRPEVPHAQVTRPPQRPQPIFRLRTWGFVRFVIASVEESRGVWGGPPQPPEAPPTLLSQHPTGRFRVSNVIDPWGNRER